MDIAGIIRSVAATQPAGARFVSIGLTTWGTKVADAEAAMAALGDGYVAVAPDAFAGYLRGAHAAGYQGSAEPPRRPVAAGAGECRGTVIDFDGAGDPFARRFLARLLAATPLESGMRIVSTGPGTATVSIDTDAIARDAHSFAASNFALAYPAGTADTARIQVALRDVRIEGTDFTAGSDVVLSTPAPSGVVSLALRGSSTAVIGADPVIGATVEVNAAYNPGDGDLTVDVTGPVGCRPVEVLAAPPVVVATPTFTG